MIAKVGRSTSIKATIEYLENNSGRVDWKEAHHLASTDKEFVIRQMRDTASMSRTQDPVYHYSISWDPDDHPDKEQMIETARRTLADLGLKDHQALIVAHNDHVYKHVHVLANRVHPETGIAWDRWMDYKKLETSLRSLERELGWKEVPGHHIQLEGQQKPKYGQTLNRLEAEQVKRGQQPFFVHVREHAMEDFRQAGSWKELHQRLAEKGLTIQRGSRGTGGKVTDGFEYANLSKIHRSFSMKNLEARFGRFQSLDQIHQSKNLSKAQKTFVGFEKAFRLNQSSKAQAFKNSLQLMMKSMKTISQIKQMTKSLLQVSTPSNPAFKAVEMMAKPIIKHLKQTIRTHEIER